MSRPVTERAHVTYRGDHPAYLPATTGARPDLAHPGGVIEVNATALPGLLLRADFTKSTDTEITAATKATTAKAPPEPVTATDATTALAAMPDPDTLSGDALDEALSEAGLPTSGLVAEKRDRLAHHQATQRDTLAGAAPIDTTKTGA